MGKNNSTLLPKREVNKYEMALQRKETAFKLKDDIGITFGIQKYLEDQVDNVRIDN